MKPLGIEYKFRYQFAQNVKVHPTSCDVQAPRQKNASAIDHSRLDAFTQNSLFRPRLPLQALIARGIQNTKCWMGLQDPLVSYFEQLASEGR